MQPWSNSNLAYKKCIDVLAPLIMEIVNLSLSTGKMPDDYKNAVLIPLLKKISLDQEIFNNFGPISNLVYISKLIEKVIASRLHSHMTNNNLYEELHTENFTVLKQHWHVYMKTYWGPLMTTKVYYLLCSIWVLLLIPLTMMYLWKDLSLDSVSVEQP